MRCHFISLSFFVVFFASMAIGQDKPPSFFELSDYRFRYPETDTNIDLYIRSWRQSHPQIGHGGFIERPVLMPGDPIKPARQGAVLSSLTSFNHAFLNYGCLTNPLHDEKENAFFYVTTGKAEITAGGVTKELSTGSWVFLPSGVEYKFINTGDEYFEAIILTEKASANKNPQPEMTTGNYRDSVPDSGWQWAFDFFEIPAGKNFSKTTKLGVAVIDAFDIAHPYIRRQGEEEIWYQITGESMMLLGTRLRRQLPGEACYVPPNGKVPHGSLNMTEEPMMWLYYCRSGE